MSFLAVQHRISPGSEQQDPVPAVLQAISLPDLLPWGCSVCTQSLLNTGDVGTGRGEADITTVTLLSRQKDNNVLTRIYQEGLRASVTHRGGGSRWPMDSVCHTLNHLPDSRSPAELDLTPRPGDPVLYSLARTLSALQQTAADA